MTKVNGKFHLCFIETYFILYALWNNIVLNKKSKFLNKCCHQNKLLLSGVTCKDNKDQDPDKKVYSDVVSVVFTFFFLGG